MKILSKNIFLMLILATGIVQAQKSVRVGYVDIDYILDNLEEYKVANEQFSAKVSEWEKDIDDKKAEINKRKRELEAEKPLLTPELIKDKEEEIDILEYNLGNYEQKRFGANGDYINQKVNLVKPIQDQVFNIVQEIGKSKNYDYIVEKKDVSMLFVNERHNLSDIILRVLNRNSNAEDRHKSMVELLKETYNFELMSERQKKEAERDKKRENLIQTKQAEREARRQKILQERKERLERKQKEREERQKKKG